VWHTGSLFTQTLSHINTPHCSFVRRFYGVAYSRDWSVIEGRFRSGSSWFSPVLPANANTTAQILIYPRLETFPYFSRRCKLYHRNISRHQTKKAQAAAHCRIATTIHAGVLSPHGPRTSFSKLWPCACVWCVCVTHTHTHTNRDFAQRSSQKLHLSNSASVRHEQGEGTKLTEKIIPRQGMMKFRISLIQLKSVLKTNI